ncbi:uncharacterized protein LOC119661858 [Teleopsis dalmanni]|uniref:uncharacterized protein LOC119661858 n=1 Tax=Teleopsis dalmanni TaxID=139649 RepID=UPI0018CDC13A|nr:uncharacterized protein LOC119661858 [Teleopsis dalmanni]
MHIQRTAIRNLLTSCLRFESTQSQKCTLKLPSQIEMLRSIWRRHMSSEINITTPITFISTSVVSKVEKQQFLPPKSPQFLSPFTQICRSTLVHSNNVSPAMTSIRPYSKFTNIGTLPLSEEKAQDLIFNLKDSERAAIKTALQKYEAAKLKEGFEGDLAATRWRTRFGRLTKLPALGDVDPTGSYCAFPDDWLKKKAAEKAKEPTRSELWRLFLVNAAPFFAFGFLDNFVMVVAGDYIELVFGTFMCISTMAAAGLGNTVSDVIGIGSAVYVERGCDYLGFKPPDLTPVQMEMKSSRRAANFGRIIGITIGCLIGMFPLLFLKPKRNDADSEEKTDATDEK